MTFNNDIPLPIDGLLVEDLSEWYDPAIKEKLAKKSKITSEDMFCIGSIYEEPINLFQYGIANDITEELPNQLDIPPQDSIFFHNLENRFVEKKDDDVSWMRKSKNIQESRVTRESILTMTATMEAPGSSSNAIKSTIDGTFNVQVPNIHPSKKVKMKRSIPFHPYFQCYGPEYHQFIFPDGLDLDESEQERHLNTLVLKPHNKQYALYKCNAEHAEMILQCREEDRDLANEITYNRHRAEYKSDEMGSDHSKFVNIVIQENNAYYIPTKTRNTMRKARVLDFNLETEVPG